MNVLAINSGRSSLKFKVVEFGGFAGAAAAVGPFEDGARAGDGHCQDQ
jgi:acetate kinase